MAYNKQILTKIQHNAAVYTPVKEKFLKGKIWWCGTNSNVNTPFYKYVECNVKFINPSNGILDTQYRLPNERSLTGYELFYIICWHYTNLAARSGKENFWQLTFDVDQNHSVLGGREERRHQPYSETTATGERRRCGQKVESSLQL